MKIRWALLPVGLISAFLTGALIAFLLRAAGWWEGALWEQNVLHAAQKTVSPWLDRIMLTLPLVGTNYTLAPIIFVIAIVLWSKHNRAAALHLAIAQLGSWALNPSLKLSFPRERPTLYEQRGQHAMPAFPSGHSIAVTAVLFTAAYLLWRYRGVKWPFYAVGAFFLLNSYSRVYLSVHWPTDVLGGTAVGAVWFTACYLAFDRAHPDPVTSAQPDIH